MLRADACAPVVPVRQHSRMTTRPPSSCEYNYPPVGFSRKGIAVGHVFSRRDPIFVKYIDRRDASSRDIYNRPCGGGTGGRGDRGEGDYQMSFKD
eukprot:scaffold102754_cov63-Phaeocystis_antarctica.AAC.4